MRVIGDDRAQSVQIGAVLVFAALIIAFATYQAVIIPQQNKQVEFDHNQQVQRDMVEVRNTLLETYTGGSDGYAEIALGTDFPPRLLGQNPPAPSGSLYTTSARPIVIEDESGTEITSEVCPGTTVETRFLEYTPRYSEFQNGGTLRYESSVVVQDYRSRTVTRTGQTLVRNDTLQVIPLTREFSVGGTQTVTVEPRAGRVDRSTRTVGDVTLPTRTGETTWERLLEGQVDPANVTVTEGPGGRNVTLTLDGQYTVECGPVGVGATPESGARDSGGSDINPADIGDIRFETESLAPGTSSTVLLSLNNTATSSTNITEARINFYQSAESSNQQTPTRANVSAVGGPVSATLQFGASLSTLNPDILLPADTTTQIALDLSNDQNADPNLDGDSWFVITLSLETGEQATYFVSIPG